MNEFQQSCLLFVHIPKTAGTTLKAWLSDQYSVDEIAPFAFDWELPTADPPVSHYRLVATHIPNVLAQVQRSNVLCDYLTVLRDPISRCVSQYHHWVAEVDNLDEHRARVSGIPETFGLDLQAMAPADFISKYHYYLGANGQVNWLAACALATDRVDEYTLSADGKPIPDEKRFDLAWGVIRAISRIGFVEDFDTFLMSMSLSQGLRPCNLDRRENPSQKSCDVSTHIDDFSPRCALDRALYDRARNLSDATVRAQCHAAAEQLALPAADEAWTRYRALPAGPSIKARAGGNGGNGDILELAERIYAMCYHQQKNASRIVHLDASGAFVGDGWQRREHAPGVRSYRWSGPTSQSDIDLPVTLPKGGLLTVVINAWVGPLEVLRAYANGATAKHSTILFDAKGTAHVVFELSPVDPWLGFTRLTFEFDHVRPLNEVVDTPDNRRVGFSIESLTVTPYIA